MGRSPNMDDVAKQRRKAGDRLGAAIRALQANKFTDAEHLAVEGLDAIRATAQLHAQASKEQKV